MLKLATARCVQYKRNIDPSCIVSNCYLHLIKHEESITEANVQSYAFSFINMSAVWTYSRTNVEELQTNRNLVEFQPYMVEHEEDEISDKIKEHELYQEQKAIIALYRQRLCADRDKVQLRLLDTMIKTNKITSRGLAEHFDISDTGAWKHLKKLKEDIRAFKIELNKYDKKNNF